MTESGDWKGQRVEIDRDRLELAAKLGSRDRARANRAFWTWSAVVAVPIIGGLAWVGAYVTAHPVKPPIWTAPNVERTVYGPRVAA